MDFALVTGPNGQLRMSLDGSSDIRNNILLSLYVKRGSFFLDLNFGSRLYEIKSLSEPNVRLAKEYVQQALQWILEIGRADRILVVTSSIDDTLKIATTIIKAGVESQFETFYRVA